MATEELYALLLPLEGTRLLLPNAVIAEVVSYTSPQPAGGDREWFLGEVHWQGQQVPLVSFEALCGRAVPAVTPRARVAILYAITGATDDNYIGIVTEGHPHLVRLQRDILVHERSDKDPDSPILSRVRIANAEALIPNVEMIENAVARQRAVTTAGSEA